MLAMNNIRVKGKDVRSRSSRHECGQTSCHEDDGGEACREHRQDGSKLGRVVELFWVVELVVDAGDLEAVC